MSDKVTRIILEQPDRKFTWETKYLEFDASDLIDVTRKFALCLGFDEETIIHAAIEYIEMYSDEFQITPKAHE